MKTTFKLGPTSVAYKNITAPSSHLTGNSDGVGGKAYRTNSRRLTV